MTRSRKPQITWMLGLVTFLLVIATCAILILAKKNHPQSLQATPEIEAEIPSETLLSPLALEGRDIYNSLGCPQCHQGETIDASLVLAGGLFASSFPFREEQLKGMDLNFFLTGKTLKDTALPFSTASEPSDRILAHTPLYPQLSKKQIMGYTIQAKMIASTERGDAYTHEQMVQASAEIAGSTQMEALEAYLHETAIQADRDVKALDSAIE